MISDMEKLVNTAFSNVYPTGPSIDLMNTADEEFRMKEQTAMRLLLLHKYLLNVLPKFNQNEITLPSESATDVIRTLIDSFLRGSSAERLTGIIIDFVMLINNFHHFPSF